MTPFTIMLLVGTFCATSFYYAVKEWRNKT